MSRHFFIKQILSEAPVWPTPRSKRRLSVSGAARAPATKRGIARMVWKRIVNYRLLQNDVVSESEVRKSMK